MGKYGQYGLCYDPADADLNDRYFDEILKSTPEDVEDVMVEADGEWHTSDNTFASAAWKATHKPQPAAISLPPTPEKKPALNGDGKLNGSKDPDQEVFVLDDSDDEEEGQVKRELSLRPDSSILSSEAGPPDTQPQQVIDLTLDSDDDELAETAPPLNPNGKRKAYDPPSPTEPIWKKSRIYDVPQTVMRSVGNSGNVNGPLHTPSSSNPNGSSSYMNDVGLTSQYPNGRSQYEYDYNNSGQNRSPQAPVYPSTFSYDTGRSPSSYHHPSSHLASSTSRLASTLYKDRYPGYPRLDDPSSR